MNDKIAEKIAEMVGSLSDAAQAKKRQAQEELERRRKDVLIAIGQAAERHGLDMDQPDVEVLRERMVYAQALRISQAEAVAKLALDRGNFDSEVVWWDLKEPDAGERDPSLWKGYVVKEPLVEIRFWTDAFGAEIANGAPEPEGDYIEIEARYACEGIYVASVTGGSGVSVGISRGEGKNPASAVEMAYRAHFPGMGVAPLPTRLLELLEAVQRNDNLVGLDNGVKAGIG